MTPENSQNHGKSSFDCEIQSVFQSPPMGFGLTVCDYTEKNNINNPFQIMKVVLWSALSLAVPSYTSPSLQLFPQDMGTSPIISPLGVDSSNYVVLLKSSSRRKKNWVRV